MRRHVMVRLEPLDIGLERERTDAEILSARVLHLINETVRLRLPDSLIVITHVPGDQLRRQIDVLCRSAVLAVGRASWSWTYQ